MPLISSDWRPNLHSYPGGIIKGIKGVPLAIGGIDDHVHLLIGVRAIHRLDYFLRDIKAGSSSWVHNVVGQKKFAWQSGYLGLTVSPSQIERVRKYAPQSGAASSPTEFSGRVLGTLKTERN